MADPSQQIDDAIDGLRERTFNESAALAGLNVASHVICRRRGGRLNRRVAPGSLDETSSAPPAIGPARKRIDFNTARRYQASVMNDNAMVIGTATRATSRSEVAVVSAEITELTRSASFPRENYPLGHEQHEDTARPSPSRTSCADSARRERFGTGTILATYPSKPVRHRTQSAG